MATPAAEATGAGSSRSANQAILTGWPGALPAAQQADIEGRRGERRGISPPVEASTGGLTPRRSPLLPSISACCAAGNAPGQPVRIAWFADLDEPAPVASAAGVAMSQASARFPPPQEGLSL